MKAEPIPHKPYTPYPAKTYVIPKWMEKGSVENVSRVIEKYHRCLFVHGLILICIFWAMLALFVYLDQIFPQASSDLALYAKQNKNAILLVAAATILVAGIACFMASCVWIGGILQIAGYFWAFAFMLSLVYFYKEPGWMATILVGFLLSLGLFGYGMGRYWQGYLKRRQQSFYVDEKVGFIYPDKNR
ncbi:hypothetical protein Ddc_00045 [Ditylenchus destructor]|nr:hypothetical protein Ddc_00045 [Ditylenchus destructor]